MNVNRILSAVILVTGVLVFNTKTWAIKEEPSSKSNSKPNFIIIMADDLDSRQLSCYGGKNINTKNIDALASEGLKFNQIITSEAMCIPTRASLFTGLYPVRHGAYQNHKPVYNNLKSVGYYLGDLGYKVGLTGKDHVTKPKSVFPFQIIPGFEPNCVATTDEYFLDSVKTFITEKDKPYCLFVMSCNPHAPWTVGDPSEFNPDKLKLPAHWVDTKLTRTEFCKYLAEVRRLDNQVGDVMNLLKQTGQDKNTIVIFLGEQGPQFPGGKWSVWDNGAKSSMIVKWPGNVKSNSETQAIVQYEDITPTLIDIAGGRAIAGLDGKSILNVIQGKSDKHREFAYLMHNNVPEGPAYASRAIRDGNFKLINNLNPESSYYIKYMMNTTNDKLAWNSWMKKAETDSEAKILTSRIVNRPPVEFYDIKKDPYELNNLADKKEYQALIKKYDSKLREWMEQQGDKGAALDIEFKRN
ncbi:MAG: N-sulfoglucosamine sulfohydrolase [Sphingobacteriales bacterium]|nr:N-sulfoglucosamine sulfohydrolase [Sphingobacteriales bacterium]